MDWLDELKKLEAEATPGPWESGGYEIGDSGGLPLFHGVHDDKFKRDCDARLIAAMRNALPRLLRIAEVAGRCRGIIYHCNPTSGLDVCTDCGVADDKPHRETCIAIDLQEALK